MIIKNHKKYWKNRKIDWNQAYFNLDHPHRDLIIRALRGMKFATVYEIGCGAGANLYKIQQTFGVRVGGIDINPDAIEEAKKHLRIDSIMEASDIDSIFMNDKSVDVLLSDMTLIYIGPLKMRKVMKEIVRITRRHILLVEFHSTSFWKRLRLYFKTGYFSYNYRKLLEKYGFYDVEAYKLKEEDWPGGEPQKTFGYIIKAKI